MSVAAFLAELRSRDIQVWADGNRLRCDAPAGVLAPDLRAELRQRKSAILQFLRAAESLGRQQPAIVPMQPSGTRTPVFAVAGHNGDVFCYQALAQHLSQDQPFFALQPPGLDGRSEPLACVEDLAGYFAGQIRAFRPNGPYVIAGYCAGGTIAFELARQLRQHGAAISCVALFASPFPSSYRLLSRLGQMVLQQMQRVSKHKRALASRSWAEHGRYIREKLRQRYARRHTPPEAVLDPTLVLRARVEHATLTAVRRYNPGPLRGRVALVLPSREWARSGNAPLRWRSVARDTAEYFGPPGCDGANMLREPHAAVFAELLTRQCRD